MGACSRPRASTGKRSQPAPYGFYVRQRPGPANSLGQFKFDLPDGDGIYLHDTPKKELFVQEQRKLSHGCVRLEDAPRLARWLLGKEPPAAVQFPSST